MSLLQSKKIRISLLLVVVLLMLAGSALTPYSVDDWSYMFSFATGERIASVGDIFPSMAAPRRGVSCGLYGGARAAAERAADRAFLGAALSAPAQNVL